MRMFKHLIAILVFPIICQAQYEGVYDIPLPDELSDLKNSLTIYSSPNPDFPVDSGDENFPVVWKHKTVIKANEDMKILETGAYLLNRGEWMLRAAFQPKMTKKLFNTKSLKLSEGDSIIFQENWRYGNYTQTGWNFWYVKAKNKKGEIVYGYEILETKGAFENGMQILPIEKNKNRIEFTWLENEIGNDLLISTRKEIGSISIKENQLLSFKTTMDISDLLKDETPLFNQVLDLEENPELTITTSGIERMDSMLYQVKGDFCLNGKCNQDVWTVLLEETETAYNISFDIGIELEEFSDMSDIAAEDVEVKVELSYQKDYPGSMPWNDLGEYSK